jgi:hypothetical protein
MRAPGNCAAIRKGGLFVSLLQSLTNNVLALFYEEPDVTRTLFFPESVAGGFTVPDPASKIGDRHIQFEAPGLLEGSLAAVFFQTTVRTETASFSVRLNTGEHLVLGTFASGDPHSWHKLARAGTLRSVANELVFAVSEGEVSFSDVFIVYTSNQLTVRKRRNIVATQ